MNRSTLAVMCAGVLMVAGCSRSVIVPVSGRVTLDGQPVANASVSFQPTKPVDGKTGTGSFARTDADGRYRLELITVAVNYGAVVGEHKVAIQIGSDAPAA